MGFLVFILFLFVVFVGGGWLVGRSIGGIFSKLFDEEDKEKNVYIDRSVHYHIHNHEHKNLTVIDEETHKKGLKHFSDKKEDR